MGLEVEEEEEEEDDEEEENLFERKMQSSCSGNR